MAQNDNFQYYVARFRRRLRLRNGWLLAQRSLWPALAAAAGVQAIGRIWPVKGLWLWALVPLAVWLLGVLGFSLLCPLPPLRVARRIDAELGLKERLATALLLENGQAFRPHIVALQRQDALSAARAIHPRQSLPLRWLRRSLLLAVVFAAATLALALLPNPMDAVLEERAAVAQAADQQAQAIDDLRQEIEQAQELTPEEREALLRQLAELAEQLRANPGDREEALADLSRVEEALRQRLDPNVDARRAALEALSQQLQTLTDQEADPSAALEKLAEQLAGMDAAERESLARSLAQMAARAAQAGDMNLAQALAAMAQAAQAGDAKAASQAAQAAAEAMAEAQGELADQETLQRALDQLQASRQSVAQAGQGQAMARGAGQGEDQGQGEGEGQGEGQPGSGGGTQADTLPPARRTGQAGDPQGEGQPGTVAELGDQVYVPWERWPGAGEQVSITGPDTGEGETQVREQQNPLPGAPGEALVPYHQVYEDYLGAATQALERSTIPLGLKDYVRDYFSQLEP